MENNKILLLISGVAKKIKGGRSKFTIESLIIEYIENIAYTLL